MENPTWTDQLSAWSTFATAVFSFALVVLALWAGRTAIRTLRASQGASEAAIASAEAARAANEQARFDSIEQTRPYVYAEVIPGLSGGSCYDLRLRNCGKSTARDVTLEYSNWPDKLDDVAESIKELFQTPRSLPPSCQIRAVWRLEGNFTDGTTAVGLPGTGLISVRYTSDDPSGPNYVDRFDVSTHNAGLWPMGEQGPEPPMNLSATEKRFYKLGQVLIRRIAELSR